MREIKFRAWDGEKMIYQGADGYFNKVKHPKYPALQTTMQLHGVMQVCEVMQFTGLLDKNGKEIYEGDVVKVTNKGYLNGNKVVVWDYTLLCYVLVWAELYNEWKGAMSGTTFLKVSSGIKCEISGNIYENPELLNSNA